LAWVLAICAACSGSQGTPDTPGTLQSDSGAVSDTGGATDAAEESSNTDAAPADDASRADSGSPPGKCTTSFVGTALTGSFGRMDGHLVAIVPTNGPHSCRADSGHVHLQVKMNGVVYDVAVNTDTYVAQKDAALPDGAWTEGWHGGVHLDYPTNLGLHTADFPTTTASGIESAIETALAGADEIAIFATPYDPTGAHDVHRKAGGFDGAIFVNPSSPQAHVLAFRFSTDTF
jgi:hypothetical protein